MNLTSLIVPPGHAGAPRISGRARWAAVLLAMSAWFCPPAVRADETAPQALIQRVSEQVLARIKADPGIQAGDFGAISALVDEAVMPHVNFTRMTQLAVGLGWREASPAQRAALTEQFRVLLLRTYAGALSEVRDETVRMRRPIPPQDDGSVIVRSEIIGHGEPIELGYRLERSGDDWRIYDLNILGVWLVATYRNQFRPIFNDKGVDGLISALTRKNEQAAQHGR